jgi:two-component system CheB/CheR fusion protein
MVPFNSGGGGENEISENQKETAKRSNKKSPSDQGIQGVPIVGVGASAGGLEAFKSLLENLPVDTGLSFVIIQHLAAGQESMLTDILSRLTKMPVQTIKDKMSVEPDHVYVIPSGTTMTMENKLLSLHPKGTSSVKPIDAFFISLAEDSKNQSIGIVLSGTGSDGTIGLKAIKAQGGITFAQTPNSAQYGDMPQSAISAEAADFVLSPDKIALELQKIAKNPQLERSIIAARKETGTKPELGTALNAIFNMLKTSFNVDFSHYKETVVNRRIARRMVINNIEKMTNYAEYLRTHPNELDALYNDMLIGVTSFFREPDTFDALKETVFPELVKNRLPNEPIRVWIPGCSTGEEAYSFAIAIQEYLEEKAITNIQVQIFGTDVNERNVEKARQGIYLKTIETDLDEKRLKHFFKSFNGNYQICKNIRDMCVFARQDITADPPFSKMDLIICRNMLIYFDERLHEKVVPILHYALKIGGFLVLGQSESIGKFTQLFEPVNSTAAIYTKKRAPPHITFGLQISQPYLKPKEGKEVDKKDVLAVLKDEVDRLLVTEYVPAALLVNADLDVLIFRGNIASYVLPESGLASFNLAKIIRKELRSEVQTIIYRAKKENKLVKENAVRFEYAGEQKTINIQVVPLQIEQYEAPFFLLLFEDVSSAAALLRQTTELNITPEGRENVKDRQNKELREELESTKQSLQRIIETQEATNEELRTTMEEAQSTNEELQSTNEELETAKEELQSTNEELKTLNDEVKNRNQTLAQLNDDLTNINRNVRPAIVIIDKNLKIRLFSPSAQKTLNLSPATVGLPITTIKLNVIIDDLGEIISEVLSKLSGVTKEEKDEQGHYYEMQIRPYITQDDKIEGAVLSFVDIDDRKKLEKTQRLAAIGETAGMVGHDIRNPLQAITGDIYLAKTELASTPESQEKKNALESLQEIEKNIDYINKIVADLQDYAKTINPTAQETDLEGLCKELLRGKNIPKNIKASCNIEMAAKKIMVDCNLLKRILENLVTNAVQAMPNGGELTVRTHKDAGDIVITVQDTGIGIPDKVKPKLFTPFFTTKSKGQGLGLAVVKRMAEALKGTVTFESIEGNGTTFIVRLPPNAKW